MMYDADYYLRGQETGKSLYKDYRWMPELTVPMVKAIIRHCRIGSKDSVLDFGCARGYTVKAFRSLIYDCRGIDISEWAIANCDPEVKDYVECTSSVPSADWIIAKDVLEHVSGVHSTVTELIASATVGVFVVVPLAYADNAKYVVAEYEKDVTHVHRLSLPCWVQMFLRPGWEVTASYRVPGVKDNYAQYERGNGFITARRI